MTWRVGLVAVMLFTAGVAGASTMKHKVADARKAEEQLALDQAVFLLQQALAAGDGSPHEVIETYSVMGEVAAVMGYRELSVESFSKALELDPAAELSPSASPRIRAPFLAAKAEAKGGLTASATPGWTPPAHATADVHVDGDPYHLVSSLRLHIEHAKALETPLSTGDAAVTTHLSWDCATPPCHFYVALIDKAGNELRWVGSPSSPLSAGGAPNAALEPVAGVGATTPKKSWTRRAIFISAVVIGVGAAVATTVFAINYRKDANNLASYEASPGAHKYSEAQALRDSEGGAYTAMWVSAGILAGAGTLMAFSW